MILRCISGTVCSVVSSNQRANADAFAGMNDVLPKPFTKEGLLHMLEKHLAHLKNPAHGAMETMVPPHVQALNAGSTRQSLKDEESPAKSPATTSNWNSPNQVPGVSPVASTSTTYEEHANMSQGHPAMYAVQNPMQVNPMSQGYMSNNPATQMQMQQRQNQHRRQISDISGGDEASNNAKRQQMYPPMQQHPQQIQRR
jgi:osomolarity two-component system response regulator SKN7